MAWTTCDAHIYLATPIRSERVRGFQPPWRTVYVYRCPVCQTERRVRANSYRGRTPVPSVGAMVCGAYLPDDVAKAFGLVACDHCGAGRQSGEVCQRCGAILPESGAK